MRVKQPAVSFAPDNKILPGNLIPNAITSTGKKKQLAAKEFIEKAMPDNADSHLSKVNAEHGRIRNALSSAFKSLTCRYEDDDDDLLETKVVPAEDRFLPSVPEVEADGRSKGSKAGACGATCDIRNSPNRILKNDHLGNRNH